MTEQEAIKNINTYIYSELESIPKQLLESLKLACFTLKEVEQYRAIGTPEECRAAVEKQRAKKPIPIDYEKYMDTVINAQFLRGAYWCPNCRHVVKSGTHCNDCGQKLDWSEEE